MIVSAGWFAGLLMCAGQALEVRSIERELPKNTPSWIAKNTSSTTIEIRSGTDTPAHFYPSRVLASIATKEQLQNGLGADDFDIGEWVGLLEVHGPVTDYRKMVVPPGLYSLRLANQPDSDDHKDTAPGRMFALLCPVEKDSQARPGDMANLLDRAKIGVRKHASPWFAFVSKAKPGPEFPCIREEPPKHQSILWQQKVMTMDGMGEAVLGLTWKGPS